VEPTKSVQTVQKKLCPKQLFITEFDSVFKEEPEVEEVVCSKKKKEGGKAKVKSQQEEQTDKWYPEHKYQFAHLGKKGKLNLDCIFKPEYSKGTGFPSHSTAISLSYFSRPNTTAQTQQPFESLQDKAEARRLVALKHAQLQALMKNMPAKKDLLGVSESRMKRDEDTGTVSSQGSHERDSHGNLEKRTLSIMSRNNQMSQNEIRESSNGAEVEASQSSEEEVFDLHFDLDEQVEEYNQCITDFSKDQIGFRDKWLRRAIIYDNQLDPDKEGQMQTQEERYPDIEKILMDNPYKVVKKAKKKKKKK